MRRFFRRLGLIIWPPKAESDRWPVSSLEMDPYWFHHDQ